MRKKILIISLLSLFLIQTLSVHAQVIPFVLTNPDGTMYVPPDPPPWTERERNEASYKFCMYIQLLGLPFAILARAEMDKIEKNRAPVIDATGRRLNKSETQSTSTQSTRPAKKSTNSSTKKKNTKRKK